MTQDKQPEKSKHKVDHRNWKERFYKTVPMVGADGEPIPQDPPLNEEGFWKQPSDTAKLFNKQIKKRRR